MKKFDKFGIKVPGILLPRDKKLDSWSVIACDQYTQDQEYWKKVSDAAGSNPSTLNLILPEVYLGAPDRKERLEKIRVSMSDYVSNNVFDDEKEEFIYVERTSAYGRTRKGLVCAINLDAYEWKPFSKNLIRATEATIVDRIPPRKEIRKNAPLELPHIMLLVNDPEHSLVEKTGETAKKNSPVYDGDLMLNAGHISGWAVKEGTDLDAVYDSLEKLFKNNTAPDGSTFMFAVGDGNHSLATAKAVWDEYREELKQKGQTAEEIASSNVRYALVEIVNIYDEGLTFEPIHRVLFNAYPQKLISYLADKLDGKIVDEDNRGALEVNVKNSKADFGFVYNVDGNIRYTRIATKITDLAVSRLQPELDEFIKKYNNIEIDYIHGTEEVFRLGQKENAISILLPPIAKDSFFDTISTRGPLPRKSFSMGEADEKRFYLECRRLFS